MFKWGIVFFFCLFFSSVFLSSMAHAKSFRATIYSDGYACPGNCDAHVVINKEHNPSKYVFDPKSTRQSPKKCRDNHLCTICFNKKDSSCLTVMYRGEGPPKWKFDFTPAFYKSICQKKKIPSVLRGTCERFVQKFETNSKENVYCTFDPTHKNCKSLIKRAKRIYQKDKKYRDECLALTEEKYNEKYASNKKLQRKYDCNYEMVGTGGPNSYGVTWRRLLPASCTPGSFVGRNGLDCCDRDKLTLGGLGKECTIYLVPKK